MAIKDNLLEIEVVYSKLNKALDENISRLNTGATAVENYNKKISVVPSEFQKSLTEIKTKTDAVTVSARKLEQQSIKESNARNALNKQRESSIKQLEKEQLQAEKLTNTYEKVKAKINSMLPTYNDLKTKTELGIKLSAKESAQLEILEKRLIKYRGALNSVNKSYGNYSLEVGNYAKGTKNLNFAIAQISRELPNFGQSFEIGVLSLTNNIGAIIDGVKQVKNQNIELQSQGLKTQSVMKTVGKALFGWQTALFVGIGLFSAYSKEIKRAVLSMVGLESSIGSGEKAIERAKKQMEKRIEVENKYIETIKQSASEELTRSRTLFENAKNVNLPMYERLKAIEELKKRYPQYLSLLSDQKILAGDTAIEENKLNSALINRGIALGIQDKIKQKYDELTESIVTQEKAKKEIDKINEKAYNRDEKFYKQTEDRQKAQQQVEGNIKRINKIFVDGNKEKQVELKKEIDFLYSLFNNYSDYIDIVNDVSDIDEKNTEAKKEEQKFLIGSIGWYEKRIATLTEEAELIKKNSKVQISQNEAYQTQLKVIDDLQKGLNKLLESKKEELKLGNELKSEIYSEDYFNSQISNLESRLKLINKENEAYSSLNEQLQMFKDMRDAMYGSTDEQDKAVEKLEDFIDNFKRGFINSFKDNSGFGKLFDLFDKESSTFLGNFKDDAKATALAVSDAFQEAFNTIANANQQNFDLEYSLNEQRYQNALAFANGNAEAEEELAREKERREKEIAKREAQARKKLALFNITIDGAQALVAAAPNPFLMALVGALTAAQLALVSSQQIPEFWKGTENAPEGWAKTDERGAEIHTDSKGKIKDLGSDKGTRVKYLSKGDKIINAQKTKELLSLSSFNKEYNDMLFRNQILPPIIMNNSNNIDLSGVESKLDKLVNKSEVTIVDDENGRRYFEKTQNSKMELKNSRIFIKSRNVRA
jgi:hypothetical protein